MKQDLPERMEANPRSALIAAGVAMRAALEKALQAPASPLPGCPAIPDHALLQRIGTGAYGDVWLARSALGSLRAIKVVYRDRFDEERPFQREFHGILKYEPVSRTHPGLVAILHVGRNDQAGYFYYVMELADPVAAHFQSSGTGLPLERADPKRGFSQARSGAAGGLGYIPHTLRAELAGRRRLGPVDAGNLALHLADALQHLHAQGLIHRDIKPSNVIFVDGQPKLADIGLVTAAGDSRSFVGTEGFIPPEGPGAPAADIYGLGKLLYELATGRDRMDFPQLPEGLNDSGEGEALLELNEVITRACAPSPQERYATVAELAAELRLFLAGHSLRGARQRERHLIFLRRFAAGACLLVVVAGLAAWLAQRETRQARLREQESRQRADAESALRRRAEVAERQEQQQLYSALVEQARTAVRSGEMGHRLQALEALRHAAAISNSFILRREALQALALPDLRFERELPVSQEATIAELDPRFERLAVGEGTGPVQIRSTADDRLLGSLPASANLIASLGKWSPDGKYLAVRRDRSPNDDYGDIEVWDVSAARRILLLHNTPSAALSFDPKRPRFVAVTGKNILETWDLEQGALIARATLENDPAMLAVAPDGERVAYSFVRAGGWTVSVNLLTNGQTLVAHNLDEQVGYLEWHPSGDWLAIADFNGGVNLLNPRTGETRLLGRHKVEAVLSTFSPDGAYLISGGWERELLCWDMQTLQLAFTIDLNSFQAEFSSDSRHCAVRTEQGIRLYAFEPPAYKRQFADDLGGRIQRAVFSPGDRWLAAPGEDRVGLWDLRAKGPPALASEGADDLLYFSADENNLFASGSGECFRWRISPAAQAQAPPRLDRIPLEKPAGFTSLAVASNTLALTTTHGSQWVGLDEANLDKPGWIDTIDGNSGLSPDGHWLAIYRSFTPVLYLYELPQLRLAAVLTNQFNVKSFAFSPDSAELGVASTKRVEFWNTATWQASREMTNFMGAFYSPDGMQLWLTRDYRSGGLYNLEGTQPFLPLPSGMLPLALSHDGRFLALSVDARRIQLWDMDVIHREFRKLGIDWASPQRTAALGP